MGHDGDHLQYERRFAKLIESIKDWDQLIKKLIVYTAKKHRERAHRYGRSPEDYAQQAIASALEMKRIYDFDSGKTFEQFLMSAIDSDVNHQLARPIHRTVRLESRTDVEDGQAISGYDQDRLVSSDRPDHVIEKIDAERETAALPADIRRLHELNQSTDYTAKEKSRVLGVTVAEVQNMQRRLKRHFKRKRDEQGI